MHCKSCCFGPIRKVCFSFLLPLGIVCTTYKLFICVALYLVHAAFMIKGTFKVSTVCLGFEPHDEFIKIVWASQQHKQACPSPERFHTGSASHE